MEFNVKLSNSMVFMEAFMPYSRYVNAEITAMSTTFSLIVGLVIFCTERKARTESGVPTVSLDKPALSQIMNVLSLSFTQCLHTLHLLEAVVRRLLPE